jgi:ribosome-binding factor A
MKHATYKRADRVGEEIRKTIAQMALEGDLRDARLRQCSITSVKMSDDLRDGRVYISLLGAPGARAEALKAFQRASGFIKTEVTHRLELRFAPTLRFYLDETLERAARLTALIREARAADEAVKQDDGAEAEAAQKDDDADE